MKDKKSVYDIVNERIIESLEKGCVPWIKPWKGGASQGPRNAITNHPYRGMNVWLTSLKSMEYNDARFLTYKQAEKAKGQVRKGEKGLPIVHWNIFRSKTEVDAKGEPKKIFSPSYYTVFNVAQCDNLELPKQKEILPLEPIAACETIVSGYTNAPVVSFGHGRACYSPTIDEVRMPEPGTFSSPEKFYSVLFHELGHSTGAKSRLYREGVTERHYFGDDAYSKEELIAEMTAGYLCAFAGVENDTLEMSASYIDSWLKALKSDSKLLVQAAQKAQKASDHILGVKYTEKEEQTEV